MAVSDNDRQEFYEKLPLVRLTSFLVVGLFGYLDHYIVFPQTDADASEPEVMIVEGQNGTGKTTIMKMIAGALVLDFDPFRAVPFDQAELRFSHGPPLIILSKPDNADYRIQVKYGEYVADLISDKASGSYTSAKRKQVEVFREQLQKVVNSIDYEFLTIERSLGTAVDGQEHFDPQSGRMIRNRKRTSLSRKIGLFLRDAQVNYKRFFLAQDLDLLPRILRRFEQTDSMSRRDDMLGRLELVKTQYETAKSFGLQTDDADLDVLFDLLNKPEYQSDARALTLIDSYLEVHENNSKSRQLIADRLVQFELIMDEFLVGKTVKINVRDGLVISSMRGKLDEADLSSGEFHFLYMMVSALLCQRIGTILAIDEPELSLHVKWQRNLVNALSRCARGASPTFFLATHSTAISAQYAQKVQRLSVID